MDGLFCMKTYGLMNAKKEFVFLDEEGFVYYSPLSPECLMSEEKAISIKNHLDEEWKNKNFEGDIFYLNPENEDQYDANLKVVKMDLTAKIEEI